MTVIQANYNVIKGILAYGAVLDTTGAENLTFTGAKIYARGGGWWMVSGYSGNDERKVVSYIKDLKKVGVPCKDCGKLTTNVYCGECRVKRNYGVM